MLILKVTTVENDNLSQDGDFCDTADDEEETESDVLVSFQEVKITEKVLKLDKLTEFSTETEPHETAIAKDETNAEQAREILVESTLTAGGQWRLNMKNIQKLVKKKSHYNHKKGNVVILP